MTTETFLDRLMMAESGGRSDARNPRSTAVGPYQFIESTFLDVVRRHFSNDVAGMADAQILALRTDQAFSRRAAAAFNQDNAAELTAEGVPATFPNLRLAFLLGPTAAIRVLQAPASTPISPLVGGSVIAANPFMVGLTAGDLAARAARDLSLPAPRATARPRLVPGARLAVADRMNGVRTASLLQARPASRVPALAIQCNRDLPSCKRWIALQAKIAVARAAAGRKGVRTAQR